MITNAMRADQGAKISACVMPGEWGANDLETDIWDALSYVAHYMHRAGLDPAGGFDRALLNVRFHTEEHGEPEAVFDPSIVENHQTRHDQDD